jgi:hypothetical protein
MHDWDPSQFGIAENRIRRQNHSANEHRPVLAIRIATRIQRNRGIPGIPSKIVEMMEIRK